MVVPESSSPRGYFPDLVPDLSLIFPDFVPEGTKVPSPKELPGYYSSQSAPQYFRCSRQFRLGLSNKLYIRFNTHGLRVLLWDLDLDQDHIHKSPKTKIKERNLLYRNVLVILEYNPMFVFSRISPIAFYRAYSLENVH